MRFLVLIPVFVLFLSNVAFIQKVPMAKMMAARQMKTCCHKKGGMMCQKEQPTPDASQPQKGCYPQNETTCIMICCFQFTSSLQTLYNFQPVLTVIDKNFTGYLQLSWKNPAIAAPWQPPDVI